MTTFQVGDTVTRTNCWDIPPGTTVQTERYGRIHRTRFGWLLPGQWGEWSPTQGEVMNRTIESLPAFVRPETYRQYVNRLVSIAVGQARSNSISMGPVERLLRTINAERTPVEPGDWVHISDNQHGLPIGAIGHQGDPTIDGLYRVYRWNGSDWVRIVGSGAGGYGVQIIDPAVGWVVDADLPAGTDEDALLISQLQDLMIRHGSAAKASNSWCGQYERSLELMSINESKVPAGTTPTDVPTERPLEIGDRVRLRTPYTLIGRTTEEASENYENYAVVGDVGRIANVERLNGTIRFASVEWDRTREQYGSRRIDATCLEREVVLDLDFVELITEDAMTEDQFTEGMRVRRRQGQVLRFNNSPTGTAGNTYDDQTPQGGVGTVSSTALGGVGVMWDDFTHTGSPRSLLYDADCLYPATETTETTEVDEALAVGDQVMLIPGRTLTCRDGGDARYREQQGEPNNVGTIVQIMDETVLVRWHWSDQEHWYDLSCFQRAEFVVGAVVSKHPDHDLTLSRTDRNMNHRHAENPDGARVERIEEEGAVIHIRWINGGTHGGYRREGLRIMSMPVTNEPPRRGARVDGVLAA